MKFGFGSEIKTMPKLLINIGAGLDIPTGSIVTGMKGESIINGGLATSTGIVGGGNNFKSTMLHYMQLSAANRIHEAQPTQMLTYDTEVNISLDRLDTFASKFENLPVHPTSNAEETWTITDKATITADEWTNHVFKYAKEKSKDKKGLVTYEAFKDPYSGKPLQLQVPTFIEIDSFSEFESSSTVDMLSKDIDSSDTNTFAMKQGLFKTKFLVQLPTLANSSYTCFLLTAQIGAKIDMATGPAKYNQPSRTLQHLKQGDTMKGVSGKFSYLMSNAWFAHTASVLKNQTTKQAEYPTDNTQDSIETELNIVRLTPMRSKSGPSGATLEIVISQDEGVLPSLTEFHYIKENNRFGISGSNTAYALDLYPDVSLSRTTVRRKIDNDKKLRRAINITSELLQLGLYQPHLRSEGLLCTPKELYDDIKALGYDWDQLLETREYWTINQYSNKRPFLSSIDLLKMRKEKYFPYFLNADKTLKKEYGGK